MSQGRSLEAEPQPAAEPEPEPAAEPQPAAEPEPEPAAERQGPRPRPSARARVRGRAPGPASAAERQDVPRTCSKRRWRVGIERGARGAPLALREPARLLGVLACLNALARQGICLHDWRNAVNVDDNVDASLRRRSAACDAQVA